MASSDTDDDMIISSALLIASTVNTLSEASGWMSESVREIHGHVNKQLTYHSLATRREIAEEWRYFFI